LFKNLTEETLVSSRYNSQWRRQDVKTDRSFPTPSQLDGKLRTSQSICTNRQV